jgi:hypothetical protein
MPTGYLVTGLKIIQNCPVVISSPIIVKSPNGILRIPDNCQLNFVSQGSIYVEPGATLEIGDSVSVFGSNPDNNITIDGILEQINSTTTTFSHEHFTCLNGGTGNLWGGLVINNTNGNITFSNCNFNYGTYNFTNYFPDFPSNPNTISGNNGSASDTSSVFAVAGLSCLTIKGINAVNSQILADFPAQNGSYIPVLTVQNCTIVNSHSGKGYVMRLCGQAFDISQNSLTFNDTIGIDIQYTPGRFQNGTPQKIYNNSILHVSPEANDSSIGVNLYSSVADLYQNIIKFNEYGIVCGRNSAPNIPPSGQQTCGQQTISNNYTNQIRVFNSSWPPSVIYNFFDSSNYNTKHPQKWIYSYCPYCIIPPCDGWMGCQRDITYNEWGSAMHTSSFFPIMGYIYDPPCHTKEYLVQEPDKALYFQAYDTAKAGNFAYAQALFDSVVYLYPSSQYASPSIKNLLGLQESDAQDFLALRTKYQTDSIYYQNEELSKVTQYMIKECNVRLHDYDDALT